MQRMAWIFLVLLSLSATQALAYILPAPFLLQMLAEQRRDLKLRDISAQLEVERHGEDEIFDERLYLKSPERMRLVDETENGRVYVEREGKRAVGTAERLKPMDGLATDLMARLLMPAGSSVDDMAKRLLATVKSVGIDTEIVSLARDNERVVYVIGAKPWEKDKPQLWLDKTSMMPVRFILFAKEGAAGARYETRLLGYGGATAGDFLPQTIERYVDGKKVWRATLSKVDVNQKLPETLFVIPG